MDRPAKFLLGCIAFAVASLVFAASIGLLRINSQLERQANAAEQMAKSTAEQTRMLKDWGEMVQKLASEPVIVMPPAGPASSPQK